MAHLATTRVSDDHDPDLGIDLLWPDDHGRSRELLALGRPHLLVVPAGDPPPPITSTLHDWIRSPIDEAELAVRIDLLRARAERSSAGLSLDDDGLLRHGDQWVALSDHQLALVRPLLLAVGCPVPLGDLQRAYADAGGRTNAPAVRRALGRLRARLAEIGLQLHLLSGKAALLDRPEPR